MRCPASVPHVRYYLEDESKSVEQEIDYLFQRRFAAAFLQVRLALSSQRIVVQDARCQDGQCYLYVPNLEF